MMRVRRWGLFALLSVLLAIVAGIYYLLYTESGFRFALNQFAPAEMQFESVQGTIAGAVQIRGLAIDSPSVQIRADAVELKLALPSLVNSEIHLRYLNVDTLSIKLLDAVNADSDETSAPVSTPYPIKVAELSIDSVAIADAQSALIKPATISTKLIWQGTQLTLSELSVSNSDGSVNGEVIVDFAKLYTPYIALAIDGKLEQHQIQAQIKSVGDFSQREFQLSVKQPAAATATISVVERNQAPHWRSSIQLLPSTFSERTFAAELTGAGDLESAQFSGTAQVDTQTFLIENLQLLKAAEHLQLTLKSTLADVDNTELQAEISLPLSEAATEASAEIVWRNLLLPTQGERIVSSGQLNASGKPESYSGKFKSVQTIQKLSTELLAEFSGDTQQLTIKELNLISDNGSASGQASLDWSEDLQWQIQVKGEGIDPAIIAPEWQGNLALDVQANGVHGDEVSRTQIQLHHLQGELGGLQVSGDGDLQISSQQATQGQLRVYVGENSVLLSGSETDTLRVQLSAKNLQQLANQWSGALNADLLVQQPLGNFSINGKVDGTSLRYADIAADALSLHLDQFAPNAHSGSATLTAREIRYGEQALDTLTASASHKGNDLAINIEGSAALFDLSAQINARKVAGNWQGQIRALRWQIDANDPWQIAETSDFYWRGVDAQLSELCLQQAQAQLCMDASLSDNSDAQFNILAKNLPLRSILPPLESGVDIDGVLQGSANFSRTGGAAWIGQAQINLPSVTLSQRFEQQAEVFSELNGIQLLINADAVQFSAQVSADSDDGKLSAQLTAQRSELQELSGQVQMQVTNLDWLTLLVPELHQTKGKLSGGLQIAGNLKAPLLDGELVLSNFSTEIPAAGIKPKIEKMRLSLDQSLMMRVDGIAQSGTGLLAISGEVGPLNVLPLDLNLQVQGDNVRLSNTPFLRVDVSPQLRITRVEKTINVRGKVDVPNARINAQRLETSATRSDDIVIVDAEQEASAKFPLNIDVRVALGDDVQLTGLGLNAKLSGQLRIRERPGRAAIGNGQIDVSGNYTAFGQSLKIRRGRLQYAGAALSNPTLDLEAVRVVDQVTAGVRVVGRAQAPELTTFAEPAMDSSNALSYLVTGKPLSNVSSIEGNAVGGAAQSVGGLLAKQVGTRIGLDDASISESVALGGAALTLGKYLSPRLYLGYGLSLVDSTSMVLLRYQLNSTWDVEVQSARENRASINFKRER